MGARDWRGALVRGCCWLALLLRAACARAFQASAVSILGRRLPTPHPSPLHTPRGVPGARCPAWALPHAFDHIVGPPRSRARRRPLLSGPPPQTGRARSPPASQPARMRAKTLQIVWHGKDQPVFSLDFHPNGTLITAGGDKELRVWEVRQGGGPACGRGGVGAEAFARACVRTLANRLPLPRRCRWATTATPPSATSARCPRTKSRSTA